MIFYVLYEIMKFMMHNVILSAVHEHSVILFALQ